MSTPPLWQIDMQREIEDIRALGLGTPDNNDVCAYMQERATKALMYQPCSLLIRRHGRWVQRGRVVR